MDVDIGADWTVREALLVIELKLGPTIKMELAYAHAVLTEHTRTLSEYGVQDDSVLTALLPDSSNVRTVMLSMQTLAGDTKPLCISAELNMYDLLLNIEKVLSERQKTSDLGRFGQGALMQTRKGVKCSASV